MPLCPEDTWQGDIVQMRGWVTGEAGGPYRPCMAMWVSVRQEIVKCGDLARPQNCNLAMAVDALFHFALESEFGGYRSGQIEVRDAALAERLSGLLVDTGIDVRFVEALPALDRVQDEMEASFAGPKPKLPRLLDARGVTIDVLRDFAVVAADYYRAAPWRFLTDADLIHIEQPKPPAGMSECVVLGAAGETFGLAFYASRDSVFLHGSAGSSGGERRAFPVDLWHVTYGPIIDLPFEDGELFEDHGLPIASHDAYPLVMHYRNGVPHSRPTAAQLRFLEAVLRGIAESTEAEIDAGRWEKDVATSAGATKVRLTIPDLIDPPSRQEWMRRGFMPDPRGHEHVFSDIEVFLNEQTSGNLDEINAMLNQRFTGDVLAKRPAISDTPHERAKELCRQAFDTCGRRRVQLAAKAVEIDPDCADAYVLLAEQAGTRDAELDFFARGVAAAERTLGPERFDRDAGHFWGVASTRPYMRARFGLAQTLERLGRIDEAVDHYADLLRLNPGDNQGVRYVLMPKLLASGRDVEAAKLLKGYDEDSANWTYARALLAFRLSGASAAASRELREAFRANPYFPGLLLDPTAHPRPDHYALGSVEEAILCVEELRPAFDATDGAMVWLAGEHQRWEKERKLRLREHRKKQREKENRRKRR